ncbi:MAG: glycosyltransferase family 2 protein [Parcubacteria group bacterium]|nr:glycosyltransferase family 2 protein [Parcubacteria group bacterium]
MSDRRKLSIIIPLYNEEAAVGNVLKRALDQKLDGWEREIITVDDGSEDESIQEMDDFKNTITILRHERNFGQGKALRTGIAHAHGDVVVFHDADGEYDPADWPRMLVLIERSDAPVVYGSRTLQPSRRGYFRYALGARALTECFNLLWGTKLTDLYTGCKMFRRDLVEECSFHEDGFAFQVELTSHFLRNNIRIREIPIGYAPRTFREGKKITPVDGFKGLIAIVFYRWIKKQSHA